MESLNDAAWKALWLTARATIDVPGGCELLRIYQNAFPCGADIPVHADCDEPDEPRFRSRDLNARFSPGLLLCGA